MRIYYIGCCGKADNLRSFGLQWAGTLFGMELLIIKAGQRIICMDSKCINSLKGIGILGVVLVHCGLGFNLSFIGENRIG